MSSLSGRIEAAVGMRPVRMTPLAGGSICDVRRVEFEDRPPLVVKQTRPGGPPLAEIEARMLSYLSVNTPIPVPTVILADHDLLLMTWLPAGGPMTSAAEADLAGHIAALHGVHAKRYGFEEDTVFATAPQANGWLDDWPTFFGRRRLLPMARLAHQAGELDKTDLARIERLAGRLDRFLPADPPPSLLHGDLWGGNILIHDDRLSGLVDPAISYGHAEMDLAFIGLFGSVGETFYRAYDAHSPIDPDFFDIRRDLYNLWPLLFHVREFGAGYLGQVRAIIKRLEG